MVIPELWRRKMTEDILISIIIPVYNAEKYLAETLKSLTKQSYANLEIICIDDGSKDRSAEIIHIFQSEDSRIKYIKQENSGPGAARNNGISLAQGKYIVFQDSDDLLHNDAIRIMLEHAEKENADVCIVSYQTFSDSYAEDFPISDYQVEICTGDLPLQFEDYQTFRGHPWGKLYRSDIVKLLKFPDLRSGEDTFFNIDVMANCRKVVVIPVPLYGYRENAASLTHSVKHHRESIEAGEAISLHCIELFSQSKISEAAAVALLWRYGTNCIMLHTLLMMNNPSLASVERKELLKIVRESLQRIRESIPWKKHFISQKYRMIYYIAIFCRMAWIFRILFAFRSLVLKVKS